MAISEPNAFVCCFLWNQVYVGFVQNLTLVELMFAILMDSGLWRRDIKSSYVVTWKHK